jgi:hypothetical protein
MEIIKQFFKDILTAKDGESFDVGRALLVFGVLAFIGLACYSIMKGNPFDALGFGGGLGAILGGGGVGIGMKSNTEPGN